MFTELEDYMATLPIERQELIKKKVGRLLEDERAIDRLGIRMAKQIQDHFDKCYNRKGRLGCAPETTLR